MGLEASQAFRSCTYQLIGTLGTWVTELEAIVCIRMQMG